MTIEIHRAGAEEAAGSEVVDAEVVDERTRTDRLKKLLAARRERAQMAWRDQRARVRQRVSDWYATADITDQDLEQQVVRERQEKARRSDDDLIRQAARLEGQLAVAEGRAARREAEGGNRGTEAARIKGELAAVQQRMKSRDAEGPLIGVEPATKTDIGRARWMKKALRVAYTGGAGLGTATVAGNEPTVLLGLLAASPFGWWYLARPFEEDEEQTDPVDKGADQPEEEGRKKVSLVKQRGETGAPAPYGGTVVEDVVFDAPPPPALTAEALTAALRDSTCIAPNENVTVLAAPPYGPDRTATIVADLPSGGTVKAVQKKAERLAAALGRDLSMIDINKAGAAGRMSLWLSDEDPFEATRHTPLLAHTGGIDAMRDGVPVAWAKRGNTVALPFRDSHIVIAGRTRSGKGVGAANLVAGAAQDVRINLRIVAGKSNGEFDPYGKTSVGATYFKQRPGRLKLLTEALLMDMNRRNDILGELSKSKFTPEVIDRLGGLEVLVIDELATFTRTNSHAQRDELLEDLTNLAAVATGAGIFLVLITQHPEVDVLPTALAMNCGTGWAMAVDTAQQSNTILGGGQAAAGRDASKFDPPRPGLGWLRNPFAGITDLARSFDLDEDERGEVTQLLTRAADLRTTAERMPGQWHDPIEDYLLRATGQSSAAGGPEHNGIPGKTVRHLSDEQRAAYEIATRALAVMDELARDAQLEEMAAAIGDGLTPDRLGAALREVGAGPTVKVTIPGRGRVQGYRRADVSAAVTGA